MNKLFMLTALILAALIFVSCSPKEPVIDGVLVGRWKFDELSDDFASTPDASGNGRHGRIHGQVLVEGVIGKALKFEGYDQIMELGSLNLTAPSTVAFWIKTNDVFRDRRLFSQVGGTENSAGALRFDGTRLEVWNGKAWQVLIDRKMRIGEWMHIAVVFEEEGKTYGFLNGERQHIVRCGFDFDGVDAVVGAQFPPGVGNLFTGLMDDLRIYSSALAKEDIHRVFSER